MSNVYIKSYEVVSPAGCGKDEIFEGLLNKRCFITKNGAFNDLYTGRILDIKSAVKFVVDGIDKTNALVFGVIKESSLVDFAINKNFTTSSEAITAAYEAIKKQEAENIFVLAVKTFDTDDIEELVKEKRYSAAVAKPFDFESDGLNASDAVVGILLSSEKSDIELIGVATAKSFEDSINKVGAEALKVEYIEACATGVLAEDALEAKAIASIFGQKPFVSSSKGMTGYSFESSAAVSLAVAAKAAEEGIIPASSFLEHSFTNEVTFAYANKIKNITLFLVNSNEEPENKTSFLLSINNY